MTPNTPQKQQIGLFDSATDPTASLSTAPRHKKKNTENTVRKSATDQAVMTQRQKRNRLPSSADGSKKPSFSALGSLLNNYQTKVSDGRISREWQDFAYRMALELDDLSHKSLYMRLAKKGEDRPLLERALAFVTDADSARSKAKLFMWKLKQLREEQKNKRV